MEELRLPADANRMGRKASFEKHAPKKGELRLSVDSISNTSHKFYD